MMWLELAYGNYGLFIRDNDFSVLAHGNGYQDNVLDFLDAKIESFTWQDDNKIYIDIEQ